MGEKGTRADRQRGGGGKMVGLALLVAAGFALVVYSARDADDATQETVAGASLATLTDEKIEERLGAAGWEIQRDASRARFLHLHLQREGVRGIVIFAEYRDETIATQQVTANREPGWATRLEGRRLLSAKVLGDEAASQRLLDVVAGNAVAPRDAGTP